MLSRPKFKSITIALSALTVLATAIIFTACSTGPVTADLVLLGGNVVTVDDAQPVAEAIAIHADTIMAVGTVAEIEALIGSNTKQIQLEGKTVIPGFIESHAHFMGLGKSLMRLRLASARNHDEIVTMVETAVAEAQPGEWILGRGWHQEKWDSVPQPNVEGLPLHEALSAISPDNPVMLSHASGHAIMVNAKAMELAGVTSSTVAPEGGEIVTDNDGNPIGIFRENAEELFDYAYDQSRANRTPEEIRAEELRVIDLATQECLSKGITSFCDAGVSLDTVDLYRELADDGALGLRLWVMVSDSNEILEARLPEYRLIDYGHNFLTVRAIKRVFDGALGSHGAWLLEPYDDLLSSTGLNTEPVDRMHKTARLAIENDFQFCTHAIGDRANREILDIYETAIEANPDKVDLRWRVEHAQHLNPKEIKRFGHLGVIASMQGKHCTSDGPWVPKRIGDKRAEEGAYVWRKLAYECAIIVNGTDAPVEDVSPLECYYATVTRMLPDGTQFYPDQCLTREEALRSYTIDAAYAMFEERNRGSLVPGKLADITVLSHDLLTCTDDELLDTRVTNTIVGGSVVYGE